MGRLREISLEVRPAGPARPGVAVAGQLAREPVAQPGLENIQGSSEREDGGGEREAEILDHRLSLAQARHLDHYQGRQQLNDISGENIFNKN